MVGRISAEKYDLDADDIPSFQNPNDCISMADAGHTIQIAEFYEVVERRKRRRLSTKTRLRVSR